MDGSFFMMPGRKKEAGDTLWDPRIPPQPAPSKTIKAGTASFNTVLGTDDFICMQEYKARRPCRN